MPLFKTRGNAMGLRLIEFLEKRFPGESHASRSRLFGFPNTTVLEWEQGRSMPEEALIKLIELGCDIEWLLTGTSSEGRTYELPIDSSSTIAEIQELQLLLSQISIRVCDGTIHPNDYRALRSLIKKLYNSLVIPYAKMVKTDEDEKITHD